jgi:hypothetical protein
MYAPIIFKATKGSIAYVTVYSEVSNLPYASLDLESLVNALSFCKEIILLR